jgi:hypothetical protein
MQRTTSYPMNTNRSRPERRAIPLAALLLGVALANLGWLGCGVKSVPIPPEAARPEKIQNLEAISANNGVRLSWTRPENYAGGQRMRDLAGFTIARAGADGSYQKLGDVPITDQGRFQLQHTFTYTDSAAEIGSTYRYYVISNTTDGYKSEPSNVATIARRAPKPPPNPENFVVPTPVPLH